MRFGLTRVSRKTLVLGQARVKYSNAIFFPLKGTSELDFGDRVS